VTGAALPAKLGAAQHPLRVAIVGSGPSGFYAAEALLDTGLAVEVDIVERWPVPYGLVRFGVAPDHPKLKSVASVFDGIGRDPRVRFFGNVCIGRDLPAEALGSMYHAVIVATGADGERKLDIEGEHLPGVHAARDFVGWYNGEPACADMSFDLSHEVAVVVGQGNVALDVCRILASPVDALCRTDIAQHALDVLAASRVREIHLVGRRGPAQAKFTSKELREVGALPGWAAAVEPASLELNEASQAELADPACANAAKNVSILRSFAASKSESGRTIHFHFLLAPTRLEGTNRLQTVTFERQSLTGEPMRQVPVPTGERFSLSAGLLFRSVGYRGCALGGLPFDPARGTVPNQQGRVLDASGEPMTGWYVTGWIKRGPTGIIGTNRLDSVETVARLVDDLPSLDRNRAGRQALTQALSRAGTSYIGFDQWLAIERAEQDRGRPLRKPAEKFVRVPDMLAAARSGFAG
jgi:ferredoxin--NADP+ reductase